ncbi:MAG: 50S ribosomal protein L15 [Candidatus Saelkia tenebricola]|nr:50S ribosomal protein L15 [Candidatus Saelkia tenebricola]
MQLHDLKVPPGAKKSKKRVGRGNSSGHGKTATRGMDGQRKRKSPKIKAYFEGGQMPLIRRIPKRGFNNKLFARDFQIINISDLNKFEEGDKITPEILKKRGLIRYLRKPVKILGNGELDKKLEISVHAVSGAAKSKLESYGVKVVILEGSK